MVRRALAWAGLAACVACVDRRPIASCDDDLGGVYVTDGGRRWMVLDHRDRGLEAYPLFDDAEGPHAPAAGGLEIGPRVIDLERAPGPGGGGLAGHVARRYLRGADRCDARLPVQVTACTGDALALELVDPVPPTALAPCTWPPPAPPRRERWRRD